MKIHLTGTNWHGDITSNLQKAFESLGHKVFFFEKHLSRGWKIAQNLITRASRKPYDAENYFSDIATKRWRQSVASFQPDLVIVEDAPNIRIGLEGFPIFYYEVSPPHGSGAKEVLLSFRYVDEVFCIDKDWAKYIEMFFSEKVRHLPLAGNPDVFYPMDIDKIYDVVMVASAPEQSPDGLMRAKLIDSIPGNLRVEVFGNGWKYWFRYFHSLEFRYGGYHKTAKEVNRIYNQSKIVLNFHSTGHISSVSSRTFEIALASAFQITDQRSDLSLFPDFPDFGGINDMNAQISEWLPKDKARQEVSQRMRNEVLQRHTWKHRAEEILKVFNEKYK